jgi:predicted RNase H-like HicB family nuclease
MKRYTIIYEQSATGYGAYVPDLPGLGVVGRTLDEVRRLIHEGIVLHIESLKKHGDPVPEPTIETELYDVPVSA